MHNAQIGKNSNCLIVSIYQFTRGKQDSCIVCRAQSVYKHVGRVTRGVEDWIEEVSM